MTINEFQIRQIPSHELYGDFWFNSEPVPISALRGRVILLDFWDYTCCSSLRALPYVVEWHKRYERLGLVVVGIHTPKFPFGKNPQHVQSAIGRLGINYPVLMDNESMIWSSYGNRVWPTKQLIDKEGFVRCSVTGEGNYAAIEQIIQSMLYNAGVTEEMPLVMDPVRESDRTGVISYRATPELFAGYMRGSVGNVEGYVPESMVEYKDPKIYFDGRFYLEGEWLNERSSLRSNPGPDQEDHVILNYQGLEVNAVLQAEDGKQLELVVQQDNRFLTMEDKGEDVQVDRDGRSCVSVVEPRMYNLVRNREFGEHVLRITTRSNACGLYSFSFVSSVIPEMITHT
jgi:thiol-disulfide isomerase/thioredoxin